MPIRGPGVANILAYGVPGGGEIVMGTGDTNTLTQDLYCEGLTMTDDAQIVLNGFRLFVLGDISMADSATIWVPGSAGADGDSGGLGGLGAPEGTIGGGWDGGEGANVIPTIAADPGDDDPNFTSAAYGGGGGDGVNGGTRLGGAGGNSDYLFNIFGDFSSSNVFAERGLDLAGGAGGDVVVTPSGGAGGGGGGANATEKGGGGGGGGGFACISCFNLNMTGSSLLSAQGGPGGQGETGGGATNGGGGGQGGAIKIHCYSVTVETGGNIVAPGAVGGSGASGGVAGGTGDDGNIFIISERGVVSFIGAVDAGTWPV